jgi:hypothetical protein
MPTPSNPGPYIHFYRPDGTWDNDGTNAFYSRGVSNTDNRYSIRIDHQFNNSNQVFGRYTYIPVIAHRYFALPISNILQSVPSDESFARNVALGYTHLFSDQLVNGFHFGYMRNLQNRSAPGVSTDYGAQYGLTQPYPARASPASAVLALPASQVLGTALAMLLFRLTRTSSSATTSPGRMALISSNVALTSDACSPTSTISAA